VDFNAPFGTLDRQNGDAKMSNRLPKTFSCPTEFTLRVLGGKWKTVILSYLKERPLRYAELHELIPGLSEKMLTQRLHDLIELELISRQRIDQNGSGEFYVLTSRGETLRSVLTAVYDWGQTHAASFGVITGDPLKEKGSPSNSGGATINSQI
jgi:DNA-binding HxlR family transcriptional regulator